MRSLSPVGAMCWKPAAWCCPGAVRNCSRMKLCARPTWVSDRVSISSKPRWLAKGQCSRQINRRAKARKNRPMFVSFFQELKNAGLPVTLREYLTLMEAMEANLASRRVDDFYFLSRAALVKDERNLDKFDRVFGHVFKGLETLDDVVEADIPAEWLKKLAEKYLTDEEKKQIEAMGGLDKLLETLRKRLAEQKRRHQGGSKWIGTAGTSPYGAYGYNPEG